MRAMLLVAVAACSTSDADPKATTKVPVKSECILSDSKLLMHADIVAKYAERGGETSRTLWQFFCDLTDKTCKGVYLRLNDADAGKPIVSLDLDRAEGATVSMVGSVAT